MRGTVCAVLLVVLATIALASDAPGATTNNANTNQGSAPSADSSAPSVGSSTPSVDSSAPSAGSSAPSVDSSVGAPPATENTDAPISTATVDTATIDDQTIYDSNTPVPASDNAMVFLPGQWRPPAPSNNIFQVPFPEGPRMPMQYFIPPGYYPPQFYPPHYMSYPSHQVVPMLNAMGFM